MHLYARHWRQFGEWMTRNNPTRMRPHPNSPAVVSFSPRRADEYIYIYIKYNSVQNSKWIRLGSTDLRQRIQGGNRTDHVNDAAKKNVDVEKLSDARVAASAVTKQDHARRGTNGRKAQCSDNKRIHLGSRKSCSGMEQ